MPVATVIPQSRFLNFPGTKQEHQFLDFFRNRTTPLLSGCFDWEFWGQLLPQVGHSEPTIQHAMIAVAVVHARLEGIDELLHGEDKREESRCFELQQYNKAIHHLRQHLSANGVTIEVTLMCCVLLVCLEFLRSNMKQAILHLRGGLNILNAYHTSAKHALLEPSSLRVSSRTGLIAQKLEEIFHRLGNQWVLCDRLAALDVIGPDPGGFEFGGPFANLEEARSSLDQLSTICLRVIHASNTYFYSNSTSTPEDNYNMEQSISTTHAWLSDQFDMWSNAFESFIARNASTADTRFSHGCNLLRIFYITGQMWLASCLSLDETLFDDMMDKFRAVIALASSVIHESDSSTSIPPRSSTKGPAPFTFEMGVIAPLYFTAIKCRDRKLRREAISLLGSCTPRKEGLWDADILVYVTRRIVEIEESGLDAFIASSPEAVDGDTLMPPEHDRLVNVIIHHKHDWQHQGQNYSRISYAKRPIDGSDCWDFQEEDIILDSDSSYKKVRKLRFLTKFESATWATALFEIQ